MSCPPAILWFLSHRWERNSPPAGGEIPPGRKKFPHEHCHPAIDVYKRQPEHCVNHTRDYMGKPHIEGYEKFREKYFKRNRRYGKDQYLVPYLISSHPGCTLEDAVQLAEWLNKQGPMPEQVQDFYPTPGTLATCMWYTGLDPRTMKPVFVPKTPHEDVYKRQPFSFPGRDSIFNL